MPACIEGLCKMLRRNSRKVKVFAGVLMPTLALYIIEKIPFDDGLPCSKTLDLSIEENLEKVASYSFPDAEKYLKDLFAEEIVGDGVMPPDPAFVTAFSGSHFLEGMALVHNVNSVARKNFKKSKFFLYDLGLSSSHISQLKKVCRCQIKQFPFDKFPDHVKIMKGYAWKPLAIQLAIKEHPFVIWMDASVRFSTSDLQERLDDARTFGVVGSRGYRSIAVRTHKNMFQMLGEEPCTFKKSDEFEATFIMIYANKFVLEYFMKPWTMCALTFGCIVPDLNTDNYIDCTERDGNIYHNCHRFDQSMLSILMYRLYNDNIKLHQMNHEFYKFCKNNDYIWFLPQFVNTIIFYATQNCM